MLRAIFVQAVHRPFSPVTLYIHWANMAASRSSIHQPRTPSSTTIFWLVRMGVDGIETVLSELRAEHPKSISAKSTPKSIVAIPVHPLQEPRPDLKRGKENGRPDLHITSPSLL